MLVARLVSVGLSAIGRVAVWAGAVGAVTAALAGWFYLRNLALYGDLTGSAALLERFGRAPKASMVELLGDLGFWRLQQRRLWDVTSLLPKDGVLGRQTTRAWVPVASRPFALA